MDIRECRVDHMTEPVGYLLTAPTFSWITETIHAEKSRICIYKGSSLFYDSGFCGLNPLGTRLKLDLEPRTQYMWFVEAADENGRTIRSARNYFETGMMDSAWQAKWITCGQKESRLPVFFRNFIPEREVASARLYICGLGLYEARINGRRVGDESLTPGFVVYSSHEQAQTYDVTDFISEKNQIEVLLGSGWYLGRFSFGTGIRNVYGKNYRLIAELHLRFEDGSEQVIGTDDSWQVKRSRILSSEIYDGEIVDDTLPALPIEQAFPVTEEMPRLHDRLGAPVKLHEHFKCDVLHTPAGELVLDTHQNMAGIFQLRVHEERGKRIRLQFGEVLQDGNFYRDNLRTARAEYVYISDGNERVLEPHFTYYGYRYVKIEGITDFHPDDFEALAIYSDMPMRGELKTGNEKVNRLISNVIWGMKSNFVDIPTDCPQRDERMGWTGDAQAFSETACFLADPWAFYKKYLYDIRMEQRQRGGAVPDVVPACGLERSSAVWGDSICIIPWNLYVYYGDLSILEDYYESMKAWVEYVRGVDGDDHGWRRVHQYGDWLALDAPVKGDLKGGTDVGFIADVYYRKSALITAKSAALLGKTEDEKKYYSLADNILKGIQDEYYSLTGRCCIPTQTAAVLTLSEGLNDAGRAKKALSEYLENAGRSLTTGFVGTPLICETLSENGMAEMACRLLLRESYPGWLYAVNLGATTIWERWNSLEEDGRISSTGMNSLNHYTYGSVVSWIWKGIAGISPDPEHPGFQRVVLKPFINRKLGRLEAAYPSPSGTYRISWEISDDTRVQYSVEIPAGCTAELTDINGNVCELSTGVHRFSWKAEKRLTRRMSIEDLLGDLILEDELAAILYEEVKDLDYLLSYTREYPLRETLTNLSYEAEHMKRIDGRIREVLLV